uniref:Myosin motor domain-containing protein n=1 Tax=Ditylenchus dipsaci TaxID=166011 RepID=A0A915EFF8_9BILA
MLNFSDEEIKNCYSLVAAIMHMGNMKFKQRPREEQAETDGTDPAERASKMYGVTTEDFLKALLRPRVKVGTEWVNKGQNQEQVAWSVGAMAKGLYSRMFGWLVQKCNITLAQKGVNRDYFIGVLDIAGFEIFDFNSFEQLWINFVNERLQQFFNHHMPMGIIAMLDEECIVPKASDMTLASKLLEQHLGKHPNFEKPKPPKGKQAEAHFAMRHYAGTVRYNVTNWLEKNKDPLNDTLVQVMKQSTNKLLVEVWGDYTTQEEALAKTKAGKEEKSKKKGKSGSFMTVSMIYRESLSTLMAMLHLTHPHFIRCIIPNEKKQAGLIDAALVLNQLTCNGVLEGIRICRKGFPNRMYHADFVQRYALLAADEAKSAKDLVKEGKSVADKMLKKLVKQGSLSEEQFRVGETKVFFKAGVVAHVEDLRDARLSFLLTGLQAVCRWYCAKNEKARRKIQQGGLRTIQFNVRKWLNLQTWVWFKLYAKVKPMLAKGKEQEEMEATAVKVTAIKDSLQKEEQMRQQLETESKKLAEENDAMLKELQSNKNRSEEVAQRMNALTSAKEQLESATSETSSKLATEEHRATEMLKSKKRAEEECNSLKKNISELDLTLRKFEAEKQSKENQIRNLTEEQQKQELTLNKLNRERKHQQEATKKLMEELQTEEEKSNQEKSLRTKLQKGLEAAESDLDREKRNRSELDKAKRKVEGELRIAHENLDEFSRQRQDMENALKKKESDLFSLSTRVEEIQISAAKLQRQQRDNEARLKELEAELENERQARARSERAKNELQFEIDELQEQLDQHNGATTSQVEINKKKDAEIAKFRREIEQLKLTFEGQTSAIKKKGMDGSAELQEQIEQLQRQKNKTDKEKIQYQKQLEESNSIFDDESKQRMEMERKAKSLEAQLLELRLKTDDQFRQAQDLSMAKSSMQTESSDFARQIEELEMQIDATSRLKTQYASQAEEFKRAAAEEAREKHSLNVLSKNLQHELEQLRESLEEEIVGKSNLLRQLNREQAEVQQWKSRFETEGLVADDDVDEMRRKQLADIAQMQNELDAANSRLQSLEKQRSRLTAELDAARSESENLNQQSHQLEKRQKAFEKTVDEWRHKADDLQNELDAAQREARNQAAEAHRLQTTQDSLLNNFQEQLTDGGRSVNELEKTLRHLEVEKDELQHALDEAEAALEAEESKVLRSNVEVAQIRAEIEKRLQEKEEDFENTRKNHNRMMDGLQASLEQETKAKTELLRIKKKLESDITELDLALEHANRANDDAQKNAKRYVDQIKELQNQINEDQQKREEFREKFLSEEKRFQTVKQEQQELAVNVETIQRFKKQLDEEFNDLQSQNNELRADSHLQAGAKNKLETEVAMLQDMQSKIEEAEHSAVKGALKIFAVKLESQLKTVETELEGEQRRQGDAAKNLGKADRKSRELQFQVEEERKNYAKVCDLAEKLQAKIKSQRRQLDEAEESAALNLQKYRAVQMSLDNAEERADSAESTLGRVRSRSRGVAKSETFA